LPVLLLSLWTTGALIFLLIFSQWGAQWLEAIARNDPDPRHRAVYDQMHHSRPLLEEGGSRP
jgi:hypothetical protein